MMLAVGPCFLQTALLPALTHAGRNHPHLPRRFANGHAAMVATAPASAPEVTATTAKMPLTWVPLASDYELDPERPTPVRYLDKRYVIWRDNEGTWRVMDDACAHRLAPLSEGRIDRESNTLECAYHGWQFGGCGSCKRIPQAHGGQEASACASRRATVQSYPTQVEKAVVWFWPWGGEPSTNEAASPQRMVAPVSADAATYTRDLPYGWDTLLENIADPSHIPFAHHGLQGTREDAIPLNVSDVVVHGEEGFQFHFEDRTMGKMRAGTGEFRAPYVVSYAAGYEHLDLSKPPPGTFNLTVVCIPTAPGWSRTIIYQGKQKGLTGSAHSSGAAPPSSADEPPAGSGVAESEPTASPPPKTKKGPPAFLLALIPVWLVHLFANRFLDSDLAFLHYQEKEVLARGSLSKPEGAYYMPAPADLPIITLRRWIAKYAHVLGPLPPPIFERERLLDRWNQHTAHCVHCQQGIESIGKWRRNTFLTLALAALASRWMVARLVAAACVGILPLLSFIERQFKSVDFKHYRNH